MKLVRNLKKADGGTENMTYRGLCSRLGINPDISFVEITSRGTIGWTAGKPDEIRMLRSRVIAEGFVPSKKLEEF